MRALFYYAVFEVNILAKCIFYKFYVCECFTYIYVCAAHVCLVSTEALLVIHYVSAGNETQIFFLLSHHPCP